MRKIKLYCLTLPALLVVTGTSIAHAQTLTCQTVKYSPSILAQFPSMRKACLDIVTRDDQYYAVFKADLSKSIRLLDVVVGQELTAYAKGSEPLLALAPIADEALTLTPIEETPVRTVAVTQAPQAPRAASKMSITASLLSVLGIMGGSLFVFGLSLMFVRRLISSRFTTGFPQ